jgi:hypothetical protein
MEKKDISVEAWREYDIGVDTPDGAKIHTIRIVKPKDLYISASGSHRVVDAEGITHWLPSDFLTIRWFAPNEPVSF